MFGKKCKFIFNLNFDLTKKKTIIIMKVANLINFSSSIILFFVDVIFLKKKIITARPFKYNTTT
jgi:hypothetical protein